MMNFDASCMVKFRNGFRVSGPVRYREDKGGNIEDPGTHCSHRVQPAKLVLIGYKSLTACDMLRCSFSE